MSIADKITSIEGHLTADYEGLENLGADLTNVNKNIQNIRTCLDNIYDSLPKTTGEGSNLSLNTLKGRINVEAVKGDTEQDSTTGYNMWGGVSFTNNKISTNTDGSFSISLNNEAANPVTTAIAIKNNLVKTLPAGTYTFSGTNLIGNIPAHLVKVTGTTGQVIQQIDNGTPSVTFTTTEEISYFIRLQAISSVTYTGTTYIQLEPGTTAHNWEEYTNGASPNPTYPQDINVVTGTQEVVVQNKNLISGGVEFGKYSDITGVKIDDNSTYRNAEIISIRPSTTYTFSINGTTQGINKFYYDENKNFIEKVSDTNGTFTTPNNAYYLNIFRGTSAGNTGWQLNYGSTASSYIEHQEQTKTLHLGDIELAKIGTYQDRIFETSGKNIFIPTLTNNGSNIIQANASVTLNGDEYTFVASGTDMYFGQVANANTSYVDTKGTLYSIEGGETIYFLLTNTSFKQNFITFYDENKTSLGFTQIQTYIGSATAPTNAKYYSIRIGNASATSGTTYKTSVMLSKDTISSYEPYGSDKWYIEKKIYKIANKTNWVANNMGSNNRSVFTLGTNSLPNTINRYGSINCISNTFIAVSQGTQMSTTDINNICINGNNMYIKFADTINTRELAEAQLDSMTNFIAYYILETPTYTEITNETLLNELNELEKMMSYNGQTNISISGNLPMLLDVTALKGE